MCNYNERKIAVENLVDTFSTKINESSSKEIKGKCKFTLYTPEEIKDDEDFFDDKNVKVSFYNDDEKIVSIIIRQEDVRFCDMNSKENNIILSFGNTINIMIEYGGEWSNLFRLGKFTANLN